MASDETEGYQRYIRSANYYNIEVNNHFLSDYSPKILQLNNITFPFISILMLQVETLGLHEKWQGGSMESYGGGYKINLLRDALEPYKDDVDKIILFTDRYGKFWTFFYSFTSFLQFILFLFIVSFVCLRPTSKIINFICSLFLFPISVVMMYCSQPISTLSCISLKNSMLASYSVPRNLYGLIKHWSIFIQQLQSIWPNIWIRA